MGNYDVSATGAGSDRPRAGREAPPRRATRTSEPSRGAEGPGPRRTTPLAAALLAFLFLLSSAPTTPSAAPHLTGGLPPIAATLDPPASHLGSALTSTISASTNATDEGQPVTFHATISGGSPPYNVSWRFTQGGGELYGPWINRSFIFPGNASATAWANDSVGGSVNSSYPLWINVPPMAGIDIRSSPTDVGLPVEFHAVPHGGTSPFLFTWSFGDGTRGQGDFVNHSYSLTGTYLVALWDNDSAGLTSWQAEYVSVLPPLSQATLRATPTVLDLGDNTTFNATLTGGSPTYLYNFTGLPTGCASVDAGLLPCTPQATGNFSVSVVVSDHAGATSAATTVVAVNPDPRALSFTALPANVTEGSALTVSFAVSGGSGGLTISYGGLPSGCTSTNTTSMVCVPSATGNFTLSAVVTDGRGRFAEAWAFLSVLPPSLPPGGSGSPPTGKGGTNSTGGGSSPSSSFPTTLAVDVVLAIAVVTLAVLWRWGPLGSRNGKGGAARSASGRSGHGPPSRGRSKGPAEEELDAPVE